MRYMQFLLGSMFVLLLDQLTKFWAISNLNWHQSYPINAFLNFTLTYNRGAAFSFLNNNQKFTHYFFIILVSAISIGMLIWLKRSLARKRILEATGLTLILGGALGNLYDRLYYGYVIDFIDVHIGGYHWPVFNLADSAICIGAAIVLVIAYRERS